MAWGRLEDKLHDNDKLGSVSDAAFRLWILALSWSNDKRTDGHIPTQRPARLMTLRKPDKTIAELVEARLWHRASSPCKSCVRQREEKKADPIPSGGYVIHDYFEYNRTRWAIEADRAQRREHGQRGGLVSASVRSREHSSEPSSEPSSVGSSEPSSDSLKGPLKRVAQPRTPVTPYPRNPGSLDPVTTGGAGGHAPRDDEPEIPDQDPSPRRSKERGGTGGLRHLSEVTDRVTQDAGRRTRA